MNRRKNKWDPRLPWGGAPKPEHRPGAGPSKPVARNGIWQPGAHLPRNHLTLIKTLLTSYRKAYEKGIETLSSRVRTSPAGQNILVAIIWVPEGSLAGFFGVGFWGRPDP